jgi:arylsulfatase A-like enzyme
MAFRPNILLITSDQQHHSMLGAINPILQTPALDRLCREGTRFDRAYCPNPTCSPTRASLITGMDPSVHGCWSLGCKLPEDVPTVGGDLSGAGYDTTLIGKAHFQPLRSDPSRGVSSIECHPYLHDLDFWRTFNQRQTPWYGFNHVETNRNHADEAWAGQHYAIWMEEHGLSNWRDFFQQIDPATGLQKRPGQKREWKWELPERFHYSVWTADRTITRIEHNVSRNEPFFCWASFADPHPPYLVPEPWDTLYDPAQMNPGKLVPYEHDSNPPHFCHDSARTGGFLSMAGNRARQSRAAFSSDR